MYSGERSTPRIDLTRCDLRQLRALCAIGRTGGFRAAADDLGYTQSAVSQQLSALERLVGVSLVTRPRGGRRAALTPAGDVVCAHAEAVLATLRTASDELEALEEGRRGRVRVGATGVVARRLLPLLARGWTEGHRVDLIASESVDEGELSRRLVYRQLDVALTTAPRFERALAHRLLLTDPYVVAMSPDDPLATQKLTPTALAGRPLVVLAEAADGALESWLTAHGLADAVLLRSPSDELLLGAVRAASAVALMSRLSGCPAVQSGLVVRSLRKLLPPRHIYALWHATPAASATTEAFVAGTARRCSRLATTGSLGLAADQRAVNGGRSEACGWPQTSAS